jgi:hypothetical protein
MSEAATSSLPSISSGGRISSLTTTSSRAKTSGGPAEAVGRQSKTLLGALLTEMMNRVVVMGGGSDAAAPVKSFHERVRLPQDVKLVESFSCEWLPGGFTVGFCRGVLHVCDGGLAFEPLAICPSSAAWSAVAQTIHTVMPSSYALVINSALCVRMRDGSTREFAMFFGRAAAMSSMVCLRKYGVKVTSLPCCFFNFQSLQVASVESETVDTKKADLKPGPPSGSDSFRDLSSMLRLIAFGCLQHALTS